MGGQVNEPLLTTCWCVLHDWTSRNIWQHFPVVRLSRSIYIKMSHFVGEIKRWSQNAEHDFVGLKSCQINDVWINGFWLYLLLKLKENKHDQINTFQTPGQWKCKFNYSLAKRSTVFIFRLMWGSNAWLKLMSAVVYPDWCLSYGQTQTNAISYRVLRAPPWSSR